MMLHKIQTVKAKENYILEAVFYNGEIIHYDVKPLFEIFAAFKTLEENPELFENVSVDPGGYGVSWNDELDLDAQSIWENGVILERRIQPDINQLIAYLIQFSRESAKLTQKELSEKTGIYQAEISKLERGIGNPSVLTLKRLADGMNMDLFIDFRKKE